MYKLTVYRTVIGPGGFPVVKKTDKTITSNIPVAKGQILHSGQLRILAPEEESANRILRMHIDRMIMCN